MGRLFLTHLEGHIYSCKFCHTHFSRVDDIISKSFHCRYGKAYLFHKVLNVIDGEKEERMMITGLHTVVDIFCVSCGSIVGWKYKFAYERTQKYKEGKFILERHWTHFPCEVSVLRKSTFILRRFKVLGPNGSLYMAAPQDDAEDA